LGEKKKFLNQKERNSNYKKRSKKQIPKPRSRTKNIRHIKRNPFAYFSRL